MDDLIRIVAVALGVGAAAAGLAGSAIAAVRADWETAAESLMIVALAGALIIAAALFT